MQSQSVDTDTKHHVSDIGNIPLEYLTAEEIAGIKKAYLFGAQAHVGQRRLSGEPYISHPVQVAKIAAELKLDAATIIASILHDVLEDTSVTKKEIIQQFGEDVANIIDGVSKITHLGSESRKLAQAESFQKMLLAMTKDLRVILVKLVDRLHNMRTLQHHVRNKQKLIAKETLEIYAPIAQRLGIDKMRRELEDLGFEYLYPERHRSLSKALESNIRQHGHVMDKAQETIGELLTFEGIKNQISSRRKSLYSIYCKMRDKHLRFSEVLDLLAIRIIVSNVDDCYRVIGLIHNLYRPRHGYFKDYIAVPKANGYQSLHTILLGPHGIPLEFQIRTHDMNIVAEQGIAVHALYKADINKCGFVDHIKAREWVQGLVDLSHEVGNSADLLENVKVSLYSDSVYVLTPEGAVITLPKAATVLDFAFAVHTDVGLYCKSAVVDNLPCSLSQELHSGQVVKIITSENACANASWLNFLVCVKARASVRHHLKNMHRDAAIELGKNLLTESLQDYGITLDKLDNKNLSKLLKQHGLDTEEDLYKEIGLGNQIAPLVARLLSGEDKQKRFKSKKKLVILGTEGLVVTYANCCHPIPGDAIIGMMNPGKGLVIHRNSCSNVLHNRHAKQTSILLEWSPNRPQDQEFQTMIRVTVQHKRGMLAVVAGRIADQGSNIEHLSIGERNGTTASITLTISIRDSEHLQVIMSNIRDISKGIRVIRIK